MATFLKRVELANKALWKRVFGLLLSRRVPADRAAFEAVRSILFLRTDRIGDMIVSTPLFRGIKVMRPGIEVGVLAGDGNHRVAEADPNVDRVYRFVRRRPLESLRSILAARRHGYDAVVHLNLNDSLTGGLLANLIAPRGIKIARESREHARFYDCLVSIERANRHSMVELLYPFLRVFGPLPPREVLRPTLGIDGDARKRVGAVLRAHGIDEERPVAVVNLTAGRARRRWSAVPCAEFARAVVEGGLAGLSVVLLAAPGDEEASRAIRDAAINAPAGRPGISTRPAGGGPAAPVSREGAAPDRRPRDRGIVVYPPTEDLMEVAALIERARVVVSPDTSIIHFAAAVGTPIVGLYTRLEPRPVEWQPFGVAHRSVFAPEGEPVAAIEALEVVDALAALLEETKP